jgi:predicted transcriptional regulator
MATIMSGKGLSQRAIAAVLDVTQVTVHRDLAASVANATVEESAAATLRIHPAQGGLSWHDALPGR